MQASHLKPVRPILARRMRPWLILPVALVCAFPPGAAAQTGGAPAPDAAGGTQYGAPSTDAERRAAPPRSRARLLASVFTVAPATLQPGGPPAEIAYRIDGPARKVRVRVEILRAGERAAVVRLRMGWKPTGVRRVYRWQVKPGALPEGEYLARLHAVDPAGNALVRTATASGRSALKVAGVTPVKVGSGVFPVRGPWSFGGEDARFGAERGERGHQGQDLIAAEGTPLVSPRAGFVYWKAYQGDGAGHYLVIRGDDGRDYVFMHLKSDSMLVGRQDPVTAGQQIAQVGNTGRSFGAHLHFEIWPTGWYAKGSQPIDPRPDLEAWAASG